MAKFLIYLDKIFYIFLLIMCSKFIILYQFTEHIMGVINKLTYIPLYLIKEPALGTM